MICNHGACPLSPKRDYYSAQVRRAAMISALAEFERDLLRERVRSISKNTVPDSGINSFCEGDFSI